MRTEPVAQHAGNHHTHEGRHPADPRQTHQQGRGQSIARPDQIRSLRDLGNTGSRKGGEKKAAATANSPRGKRRKNPTPGVTLLFPLKITGRATARTSAASHYSNMHSARTPHGRLLASTAPQPGSHVGKRQRLDHELAVAAVVIDYEDRRHESVRRSDVQFVGQRKVERGALSDLGFGPDTATVAGNDPPHLGQANADPA